MSSEQEPVGPVPVLNLPRSDGSLITFALGVLNALKTEPELASLSNLATELEADIAAYQTAQTDARGGGKGKAKVRNAKRAKVREDLGHFKDGVKGLVEQ